MNDKSFIGMGHNPELGVPDIPMGLGMALFQNHTARQAFESLNDAQKTNLIHYVQTSNVTGDDAKSKINAVIAGLCAGVKDF